MPSKVTLFFVLWFFVLCALAMVQAACSVNRIYLSTTPKGFEGQWVRTCEFIEELSSGSKNASRTASQKALLRSQKETMEALRSISPPGRLCFVCRRMRLCVFALERLGIDDDAYPRDILEKILDRYENIKPDQSTLPAHGGITLEQARRGMCRACATMPVRIQDGTWVDR